MFDGWNRIHVNSSTQIKVDSVVLHTIAINGITALGNVTLRDANAGAFPYAFPIDWGVPVGELHLDPAVSVSVQPIPLIYDCELPTGLFVDFDGTVATDLTVTYK